MTQYLGDASESDFENARKEDCKSCRVEGQQPWSIERSRIAEQVGHIRKEEQGKGQRQKEDGKGGTGTRLQVFVFECMCQRGTRI
jgi:hypothetical protein